VVASLPGPNSRAALLGRFTSFAGLYGFAGVHR
jgi:hypothetical protein